MAGATCTSCGRDRDAHHQHVRFLLPDPVLNAPQQERTPGTWMSHEDANSSVMMQVPDVGAFVRVLLPVRLLGDDTLTFGVWLGVAPDDLQRAYRQWWAPTYPQLSLDGRIANDVRPWSLLGRPVRAEVLDVDATPYLVSSPDPLTERVLTEQWPHEMVLDALPEALR